MNIATAAARLLAHALAGQLPVSHPPPPLPSAPFWERMLFEQPFGLIAGFVVLAVVLWYVFNRQGKPRRGFEAAFLALLLAAASWLTADRVQTSREQMAAATVELVDATATVDTPALGRLLADTLRFYSSFGSPGPSFPADGADKPTLIAVIGTYLKDRYPLTEHSVLEVQACEDGPGMGRTQVRVRVVLEAGIPNASWWLIRWRRNADGTWRATSIEPKDIPGLSEIR